MHDYKSGTNVNHITLLGSLSKSEFMSFPCILCVGLLFLLLIVSHFNVGTKSIGMVNG